MNEVTNIHLGRQSFTIAADAYKTLQAYLHEIKGQAGDSGAEVAKEVESRMAELLTEHGITTHKVILAEDITYLKTQLGEPRDFKTDDGEELPSSESSEPHGKRLFRDTEHGMIAGVAAGLGAFFGLPAIVFRLLFIVLLIPGGTSILIYLLLWLLVPEATTPSDRLRMQGKAVTVDSLKEVIDRADVQGAAQRASKIFGGAGETFAKLLLGIIGVGFILSAFALLTGGATVTSFLLGHGLKVGSTTIFPVGKKETLIVICGLIVVALIASMFAVVGKAMFSRKWRLPTWAAAAMALTFITAASVGVALGFQTAPAWQARYRNSMHSQLYSTAPFTEARFIAPDIPVLFQFDQHYGVEIKTASNIDTKTITTNVSKGVLMIDTSHLVTTDRCGFLCPDGNRNVEIVIHSPVPLNSTTGVDPGSPLMFSTTPAEEQPAAKPSIGN